MVVNATVITLYLMRSGPSCADALDGCTQDAAKAEAAFRTQVNGINDALLGTPHTATGVKQCRLELNGHMLVTLRDAYRDPGLTTYGRDRSRAAGRHLRRRVEPDVVLCSVLRRARATADAAFPDQDVFTAPYLSELADGRLVALDDTPVSPSHGALSFVDPTKQDWASANYHHFLTFLGGRLAKEPRAAKASSLDERLPADAASDYTAVAVTHGAALQKACGLDEEPAHNAVYRRRFAVTATRVREEPGPCELYMAASAPVATAVGCDDAADRPWDVSPFLDDDVVLARPGTFTFPDEAHGELHAGSLKNQRA